MLTYALRGIPPALWAAAKRRAANEGHTLRWVLLALLARYVRDERKT